MNNWQYFGTILTGIAALITAGIGIYDKINTLNNEISESINFKKEKEYGVVNDKDGWVNLRERPDISSKSLAKILNGTNLEILEKKVNWYKVYSESGRVGYIFKDRLILVKYEKQ